MKPFVNFLKNFIFGLLIVTQLSGCGWIKGLRKDLDDEDYKSDPTPSTADYDYYKAPGNRYVPPPPANVGDGRAAPIAGTPIDLSGLRAKSMRVTAQNFAADNLKNENSLWSEDGQNNYLFARNKLKAPGDLISVVIEDGLRKEMVNSVKMLLPPEYRDQEVRVPGLTKEVKEAAAATPANPAADPAEPAADDLLTAEVLERYPNGNVRLRGVKRIPFKHQVRNIEVLAIVKGTDIAENDMVKSSKFFEQRVELYR